MLARSGVTPQVGRQIMRHADYRTTLQHYTRLELHDSEGAVHGLPAFAPEPMKRATGTAGKPQQIPQHSEHDSVRSGASGCDKTGRDPTDPMGPITPSDASQSDSLRPAATQSDGAPGRTRTCYLRFRKPEAPPWGCLGDSGVLALKPVAQYSLGTQTAAKTSWDGHHFCWVTVFLLKSMTIFRSPF